MNTRTSIMKVCGIRLVACSFAFFTAALAMAQSDQGGEILSHRAAISLSQVRVGTFVRDLANNTGVRINVEEARRSPLPDDPPETIVDILQRRENGITVDLADATVQQFLDELLIEDDRYEYSVDAEAKTINIYPKEDSPLGWMTGQLNIIDKPVREILIDHDLLGLRERNIHFWPRGNLSWLETRVTMQSDSITARQALNLLCAQLEFKARWETQHGAVWSTGDVAHALLIHGYPGPPKPAE
jgi:hypothetical protein